jgi:hypothetical protein
VFVLSQADLPEQFVSGFAQAEGHFGVYEQNAGQSVACVFDLRVRDDDAALVEWLRQLTGLGAIYPVPARQTSAPQSRWVIRRRSELQLLIGFLRRNPMYGRKAAEFEAWTVGPGNPRALWVVCGTDGCLRLAELLDGTIRGKKAAEFDIWARALEAMAADRRVSRAVGQSADAELKALRRYEAPRGRLRRPPLPRVSRFDILEALQAFADEDDGELDVGSYMRIRSAHHPGWAARNTVARHFGSWHAALEAAGLADRAASRPARHVNRSRTTYDARRVEQRERVLASVRRFVAVVGHVPRAMEYFRWRLSNDPDTPTQSTVYNLFPGGWRSVQAALGLSAQDEVQLDGDPVADDGAAGLDEARPVEAVLAAAERSARVDGRAAVAIGNGRREGQRVRGAADVEVTRHDPGAAARRADADRVEADRGMTLDIEEAGAAQALVAHADAGVDRRDVDQTGGIDVISV